MEGTPARQGHLPSRVDTPVGKVMPAPARIPTDLLSTGSSVYIIFCHGSMKYAPVPSHKSKAFQMPKDVPKDAGKGTYFETECIQIPPQITLNTLTRLGQSLAPSTLSFRGKVGIISDIVQGKFEFEEWNARGEVQGFPNFALYKDYNTPTAFHAGIFRAPVTAKSKPMFDIQRAAAHPIFIYDKKGEHIVPRTAALDLQGAFDHIQADNQKHGGGHIYVYATFCLGGMADLSRQAVLRCATYGGPGTPMDVDVSTKRAQKTKKGKKTKKTPKGEKPSRFQRLRRSLTRALRRKGTGRRRSTRRRGKSKAH